MNTTKVKLTEIKPYWRNPRNNFKAIDKVKASISSYGYVNPIILDKQNVIIAGHTRYNALKQLDWKDADCIILDISEKKAKEYRIVDNKTADYSEWDIARLVPELRELETSVMEEYFENIDKLIEVDVSEGFAKEITQDMIDSDAEALEEQFINRNKLKQEDLIQTYCTECGCEIFISKTDILQKIETDAKEKATA